MLIAKSIRIMKFGASRRRVAPTIELRQVNQGPESNGADALAGAVRSPRFIRQDCESGIKPSTCMTSTAEGFKSDVRFNRIGR
jgi:hypothetical protein